MIAIDLGSNTMRVVQFDCQTGAFVAEHEKIVRTADGLAQSGKINAQAIQRVIEALQEAKQVICFGDNRIRAVATEALRQANNRDEVLQVIRQATGIAFEIISGEEEAKLTLNAVQNRLNLLGIDTQKGFLLVDIGGGSTELIFQFFDHAISQSFPVGIVTVAQSYHSLEAIEHALPALIEPMRLFCDNVYLEFGNVSLFVATAGTPTTVAAIKLGQSYITYDASKVNGTVLDADELDYYLAKILEMPFEQREMAVGVGRGDLIASGILIFKNLFEVARAKRCIVIDDGLPEGVALGMCREQPSLSNDLLTASKLFLL